MSISINPNHKKIMITFELLGGFSNFKEVKVRELNFLLNEQCLNYLNVIYVAIPALKQTNNVTINPLFTGGGENLPPLFLNRLPYSGGENFWSKTPL